MAKTQIPDCAFWAEATAAELRRRADDLAAAPTPDYLGEERLCFATLAVEADSAIDRLTADGKIDRDRCVYVIALDGDADPDALKAAFRDARERGGLKLPQDNSDVSETLYVGSSCATKMRSGTLRTRLKQQLVRAPAGTYALSLAQWTAHLRGGLVLRAWQYHSAADGPDGDRAARQIVLAVEDWLSESLKPMLGRRGSRH